MSQWRRVGLEMLPELQTVIRKSGGIHGVWVELWFALEDAYAKEPLNDSLIGCLYGYASWCLTNTRSRDIQTAANVCFYEDLPTDPPVRRDVWRWLSEAEFDGLRSVSAYHLSAAEIQEFRQEFMEQKRANHGVPG